MAISPPPTARVAIVIPCYNEEKYIARCLESLLANDYPRELLDIVVLDGMSGDGTRKIVAEYAAKYPHIRMLDNVKRHKPGALNLGIQSTQSDIVMRIDAHSIYETGYISKLVAGLDKYSADNVGGLRETHLPDTPFGKAIAISISHPFAVGNAYWRTASPQVREVDTVFCGCYRRSVFERIGLFNEDLLRTQDREFNYRLLRAGGKIILDPSVRCTYFPRLSLKRFARWTFDGAYWLFFARRFTDTPMLTYRNYAPLCFVLWHLLPPIAALIHPWLGLLAALPLMLYWIMAIYNSVKVGMQHRDLLRLTPLMLLAFAFTHYGYGLGSLCGLVHATILGKKKVAAS